MFGYHLYISRKSIVGQLRLYDNMGIMVGRRRYPVRFDASFADKNDHPRLS
jgi:hypothetical protein